MKLSSILLIIFCSLAFSCKAGNGIINLTDSNYAVISYTHGDSFLFKNAKATTLTTQEIQKIEALMNKGIDEHNKTEWGKIDMEYKIQLVPVINEKGEKEVWINGFCESFGNWREEIFLGIIFHKSKCAQISNRNV